ncbi:MAG: hypothetical protein RQ897_04405, partial [Thermoflexus sp.]
MPKRFRLTHWLQRGPNSIVKIHLSRRKKDVFQSAQADRRPKALRRLQSASSGTARQASAPPTRR